MPEILDAHLTAILPVASSESDYARSSPQECSAPNDRHHRFPRLKSTPGVGLMYPVKSSDFQTETYTGCPRPKSPCELLLWELIIRGDPRNHKI